MKKIASLLLASSAVKAMAHEGHGLGGSHWHSTDVWGFVVFGAMALAVWFIGRGK